MAKAINKLYGGLQLNESRIFKQYYVTNKIEVQLSANSVICDSNVEKVQEVSQIENNPQQLFDNNNAIQVMSSCVAAEQLKQVTFKFSKPINAKNCNVLRFGYNARSNANLIKVTLYGDNNQQLCSLNSVSTERWSNVLISLADCTFLHSVTAISFCHFGENCGYDYASIFQISDLCFGNILDFDFCGTDMLKYFSYNCNCNQTPDGIYIKYHNSDVLHFPQFKNARYSVLNFLIGVKDNISLIVSNPGKQANFTLVYSTDAQKTYSVAFTVPFGAVRRRIDVPITGKEGQRLCALSLYSGNECGEILLHAVSFTQQNDMPFSADELSFLMRTKPKIINPYAQPNNELKTFDVSSFGAIGNGYDCDDLAFAKAISAAENVGGGIINVARGCYLVSNITLKGNTHLVLNEGAVILQSDKSNHYINGGAYEHDSITAKVNWAHNCLVTNYPLIYANNTSNVSVTGCGTIKCTDSGSEVLSAGFPNWPIQCGGTIHTIPIGFYNVKNAEVSGIKIIRANTYHCFFVSCTNVFISGVKCYDVRCLSADGIGLCATKNVIMHDCFIRTNDDGVTLFSVYNDPRACLWWHFKNGSDNSVKNVEISNCYINSACGGGGKAIAFIPWGTHSPNQNLQEINGIYVHDCILDGGHSIGAWADNPYNGKQPFDNTETNDFSPVKNIKIINNQYRAITTLECITGENIVSDCGIGTTYKAGDKAQ